MLKCGSWILARSTSLRKSQNRPPLRLTQKNVTLKTFNACVFCIPCAFRIIQECGAPRKIVRAVKHCHTKTPTSRMILTQPQKIAQ